MNDEDLKKNRKKLDRQAEDIHRSTKTSIKRLEPLHFKYREKYKWYYYWHMLPVASIMHWIILIGLLFFLSYSSFLIYKASKDIDRILKNELTIIGNDVEGNTKSNLDSISNIKISNKGSLEIEDKERPIGLIGKKAFLGGLVSWKNVEWRAKVPKGVSIVYRIKVSNDDNPKSWEEIPWSEYYPIRCDQVDNSGIPKIKSKYMMVEIIFQSNDKNESPVLSDMRFGYTPFNENEILAFIRDKSLSILYRIFEYLEKRNQSEYSY